MKWIPIFIVALGMSFQALAQQLNFKSEEVNINPLINGTLIRPDSGDQVPLVIIIQGSGPTDRDGNQSVMNNNSLKYLAEAMKNNGIASFRYDKRIVALIKNNTFKEDSLSFDDFVNDASDVLAYFKNTNNYSSYFIAGHSQGSLIGMLIAQEGAAGFISIAGAGQAIDKVIVNQIEQQAPALVENTQEAFKDLRENGVANNYNPALATIFRPSVQPFIRSWMQYNPQEELAKLNAPVLIINGDKDLQVNTDEAQLLKQAKPDAQLAIISNMNHVLKQIEGDNMENSKSYNEPNLPIHPDLVTVIVQFINQ